MAAAAVLIPTITNNDMTTSQIAGEPAQATSMLSSELLIARMGSVLRSLGYNEETISKVGERVTRNIVASKIDLENPSTSSIQDIGQVLSADLLNREKLQSRGLYLNSNEPILLLEISNESEKGANELSQLKNDFINLLRARSVVPVRVYVRQTTNLEPSEFGFCLLNVVNTDIGGPSMVQLLDAAFHGEDWKRDLIVKEAFDGNRILWRDEVFVQGLEQPTVHAEVTEKLPVAAIAHEHAVPDSEPDSTNEPESEQNIVRISSTAYRDINEIPDESEEEENLTNEHPAMAELRQWESNREGVQHPSWSRDHDGDLLDIITTQSASIKDEEPVTRKPLSEAASDDFELIDQA